MCPRLALTVKAWPARARRSGLQPQRAREANDRCEPATPPCFEDLRLEIAAPPAVLTLDRPARLNALTPALIDTLSAACIWLAQRDALHGVLRLAAVGLPSGRDADTSDLLAALADPSTRALRDALQRRRSS